MNVSDICTRDVVAADRYTTLQGAASLMRERHVGTVVVTAPGPNGTHALGILAHEVSQLAAALRAGMERERRERASFAPLEEGVRVPRYASVAYGQP